jgi:glycosyltransferase involved in cell wall biosynthesis
VLVALPGSVPGYAASTLTAPKVRAFQPPGGDLHAAGPVDIAFRPYQPVPGWELHRWRVAGVRLVISILDTIAFHNGGYFADTNEWMAYRRSILDAVRASDAVTVISEDVARQMAMHGFPIDPGRVAAVRLGTEHLRGDDPTRLPAELHARGFTAGEFALCLGVNYSHKNRELATMAHEELRDRGFDLALVLAGPSVPRGTTRVAESRIGPREHVFVLPEVAGDERNWLLRHASLVWYPSSAEGFGLVPFEAAAFGTPTVAVDFGPIRELADGEAPAAFGADVPVLATDWTPTALADAAERLLRDPGLALRHAETRQAAARHYSWSTTAATLVDLFRTTLARPRR